MRHLVNCLALAMFGSVALVPSTLLAQTAFPCTITTTNKSCLTVGPLPPASSEGWIVGEIKQFAFGGDSADLLKQLAGQGWVECAGQSAIRKDFDELWKIVGTSWGSADTTNVFYLPDLRGLFLRAWNHNKIPAPEFHSPPYWGDPEACDPGKPCSRLSPRPEAAATGTSGASGDHVGTVQADIFGQHDHEYTRNKKTYQLAYAQSDQVFWGDENKVKTGQSGGVETRPSNAYVAFFIYVGKPAKDIQATAEEAKKPTTATGRIECYKDATGKCKTKL